MSKDKEKCGVTIVLIKSYPGKICENHFVTHHLITFFPVNKNTMTHRHVAINMIYTKKKDIFGV